MVVKCMKMYKIEMFCMFHRIILQHFPKNMPNSGSVRIGEPLKADKEVIPNIIHALEGRVSLWINNNCTYAVKVGQEGTDEVVPLGPGAKLSYRY